MPGFLGALLVALLFAALAIVFRSIKAGYIPIEVEDDPMNSVQLDFDPRER